MESMFMASANYIKLEKAAGPLDGNRIKSDFHME